MCYKLVDQYQSTVPGNNTICTCGHSSKECDSLVYGCLIKSLQSLELFPKRAKASQVESSVTTFADKLRSLQCFAYPDRHDYDRDYYHGYSRDPLHSSCVFTLAFEEQTKAIIDVGLPQPILSLFKQVGRTETLSWCSRAPPERIKLT